METIELDLWQEFAREVERIRAKYPGREITTTQGKTYHTPPQILFRGHADASWDIKSSLERRTDKCFRISDYIQRAHARSEQIESFTGYDWSIPPWPEVREEGWWKDESPVLASLPCYAYHVYLRHHGFPSPLVDWSESPYVAAFFAASGVADAGVSSKPERFAIFAYIERPTGGKSGSGGAPSIHSQGPYTKTHPRHFAQQCQYTIAVEWSKTWDEYVFCPHQRVFDQSSQRQDLLFKITLPGAEYIPALRALHESNVNYHTLFQSEDSLVQAMAMKEFELAPYDHQ